MPTDVVMPQMGESIAEGTIVRWIKKVGDKVERDEPLFEISTDKVDAEIPSPIAGVLTEILANEGETVPVNSIVAVIAPAGTPTAATTPAPASPQAAEPPQTTTPPPETDAERQRPPAQAQKHREPEAKPDTRQSETPSRPPAASSSLEERIRQR